MSKTVVGNYRDRLQGRGFEELPQLFQDVFDIAEKLNVRYVWIDSICIIQDGDEGADWRAEAPKMAQYYQYSLCTVAGTFADPDCSLLRPFPETSVPWVSRLVRLPYRDRNQTKKGYFYIYKRRLPLLEDYWTTICNSTIFRRGWVLQEWLLSKRLVWYTPSGLFFECHTVSPTSDSQASLNSQHAKPDLLAHLSLKESFYATKTSILDFWYRVIEVYTTSHLTKPEVDRILAVAGLAREVAQILRLATSNARWGSVRPSREVYLSGLWLRDIHRGLLWMEAHNAAPSETSIATAPTWSWSSILTPVTWDLSQNSNFVPSCTLTGFCLHNLGGSSPHLEPEYIYRGGSNVGIGLGANYMTGPLDLTSMSACLHLRGVLITVHVRGYLATGENLRTAASLTAYTPSPAAEKCHWRALCSPLAPEVIVGWGSLERLRMKPESWTDGVESDRTVPECADFGRAVYGLHVSIRKLKTGLLVKRFDKVADVLLLERLDSGAYSRLGVGRIGDAELVQTVEQGDTRDLVLL